VCCTPGARWAGAQRLGGLAAEAPEFDALQGRVLAGRYRLESRLGAGAMGIVYRAVDTELGRAVAVKVLRPELFGGRDSEKRFLREAEVLAALRHPNIVAVFDRGRTPDDVSFLVMELLQGQPLVALLTEHARRFEANGGDALDDIGFLAAALGPGAVLERTWLRQCVLWVADLARGLGEAHRQGILHRDVKPSNVFIATDGRACLLDFGVATSSAYATLTAPNSTPGTPAYMAPEVLTEQVPDAPSADVYGLCATLYHLLSRQPPYSGTLTQVVASVQRADPPRIGRLRPGLPPDLHAIIDCGMARRASERYAAMAQFESDLRAFLDHRPVRARPLSAFDRIWRRARRSPAARAATAVVAMMAIAACAWLWVDSAAQRRGSRHLGAMAQLPPGLTLERAEFRKIVDAEEARVLERLLDTAVDTADDPLPARLLRAAYQLDQGRAAAAAADVRVLAQHERSAVAKFLLDRYEAAAANGAVGHAGLDLSGLPEPATLREKYLVAYHALRAGPTQQSNEQATAWLEGADWLPAQEMLASALAFRASLLRDVDPEASQRTLARGLDVAVRTETLRGRRTAVSALQIASALLGLNRPEEAAVAAAEGTQLAPWSLGLLLVSAKAQRRLGDLLGVRQTCERAVQLRRGHPEAYEILARMHLDIGDISASRSCVERAVGQVRSDRQRSRLIGLNEFGIALTELASVSSAKGAQTAAQALPYLERAGLAGRDEYAVCRAIADGDLPTLPVALAKLWAKDPTSWSLTMTLVAVLDEPKATPAAQAGAFRSLLIAGLRRLALSQSPPRAVPETLSTKSQPSQVREEIKK
jgi:tRNA A-37 threonylcarbamoyl transferase component Bud32